MHRSQIRPLRSLALRSHPLTSHALAWSCDGELAVATDDAVHLYLPEYPAPGGNDDGSGINHAAHPQFSLSLDATGIFQPVPAINQQLCASAGVKLPHDGLWDGSLPSPADDGAARPVTGSGASLSQIVRVEWSPSGLGANLRPVLLAMTTSGHLLALGEHSNPRSAVVSGLRARNTRLWKILWGLGAGLPIPAEDEEGSYRDTDERITSFAWAGEIGPGRALLAYETDEENVVIMGIEYFARRGAAEGTADDVVWQVRELARFDGSGPHTAVDPLDPDYVPASLAVISNSHVGFRKVSIHGEWVPGQEPRVEVADENSTSVCLFLSADAFVKWENAIWEEQGSSVSRGVICTPFEVVPFQVDLLGEARPPVGLHPSSACSSTYPKSPMTNPISGLVMHQPTTGAKPPLPLYSAVRCSATATSQDWFETNLSAPEASARQWVEKIRQSTRRLVAREDALQVPDVDSDSDYSEDDDDDDEENDAQDTRVRLHLHRFRFWGMAPSPGGGSTAVLVSKYSTQLPSRQGLCKVMFGQRRTDEGVAPALATSRELRLTVEGRVWEWMYGGGDDVPGATTAAGDTSSSSDSALQNLFREVRSLQKCPFCEGTLRSDGAEAKCSRDHTFAVCSSSGLVILAPGVSRVCAVCQRRRFKQAQLRKLAAEHLGPEVAVPSSGELCGSCGGKFVA